MLKLCLFEPEIPQNTGNIARTCAATGSVLVLVHPLGFDISDRAAKRAGMDYWKDVVLEEYQSIADFMEKHGNDELYFFSSKGKKVYSDISYPRDRDVYFIFGKESVGLDEELIRENRDRTLRMPMLEGTRCLNLSNTAAIAAYEYYRQSGWNGFQKEGILREDFQ